MSSSEKRDELAGVSLNLAALRELEPRRRFDPALPKPATLPALGPILPERDELALRVGHGIAGLVLGESTVRDVLARYGVDCRCSCYGAGAVPGEEALARDELRIWRISYAYDRDGAFRPGRAPNPARPRRYRVDAETRRVQTVEIGVYQKQLRTTEGLGVYSRLADLLALYGPPDRSVPGDETDTHEYDRGLRVYVDRESEDVTAIELTRPRV